MFVQVRVDAWQDLLVEDQCYSFSISFVFSSPRHSFSLQQLCSLHMCACVCVCVPLSCNFFYKLQRRMKKVHKWLVPMPKPRHESHFNIIFLDVNSFSFVLAINSLMSRVMFQHTRWVVLGWWEEMSGQSLYRSLLDEWFAVALH